MPKIEKMPSEIVKNSKFVFRTSKRQSGTWYAGRNNNPGFGPRSLDSSPVQNPDFGRQIGASGSTLQVGQEPGQELPSGPCRSWLQPCPVPRGPPRPRCLRRRRTSGRLSSPRTRWSALSGCRCSCGASRAAASAWPSARPWRRRKTAPISFPALGQRRGWRRGLF